MTKQFPFTIKPAWNRQKLRLAVFVQDKRTALVHQATDIPWRLGRTAASSTAGSAEPSPRAR